MCDNQGFQSAKRGRSSPQYVPTPEDEEKRRSRRTEHHKPTEENPERVKQHVWVPPTIPYTTSASEFIYGTTAVEAALRCSKRQLYKLYLYQAAGEEELSVDKRVLRKLALSKNVKVKLAFGEWNRLLDKMSAGRPHNGCVLEASPLPRTPIQTLKPVQLGDGQFRVELAPQTREEAEVNGTNDSITINASYTQQQIRYPVIVLLEGVVDTGNLGSIIRSAYYLGVDAIVFAGRHSAPLSPITIKASAGAAENMTLLDVQNEVDFIKRSQANGWRFYAADVPKTGATYLEPGSLQPPSLTATTGEPDAAIGQSPSVIMMGYEGSGLSNHIKARADSIVSIPGARLLPGVGAASDPARVDSLNVSVAAALLMETFLRVPLGVSPVRSD
ncbi:Alpha/beta knot methyltransferase [Aspergillus recurvatus]